MEREPPSVNNKYVNRADCITQFQNQYRFLSNFYPCKVIYEGVEYPSVENAYQASKSSDPAVREKFVNIKPAEAKKLARQLNLQRLDATAYDIMRGLVRQKFDKELNPYLWLRAAELPAPYYVMEGNYWGDTYWGVCLKTMRGWNYMGDIIAMELDRARDRRYRDLGR